MDLHSQSNKSPYSHQHETEFEQGTCASTTTGSRQRISKTVNMQSYAVIVLKMSQTRNSSEAEEKHANITDIGGEIFVIQAGKCTDFKAIMQYTFSRNHHIDQDKLKLQEAEVWGARRTRIE
eukprot:768555-Hanusia_phi.AAC.2